MIKDSKVITHLQGNLATMDDELTEEQKNLLNINCLATWVFGMNPTDREYAVSKGSSLNARGDLDFNTLVELDPDYN